LPVLPQFRQLAMGDDVNRSESGTDIGLGSSGSRSKGETSALCSSATTCCQDLGGLNNAVSGISFLTAMSAQDWAGLGFDLPAPAGAGKGSFNAWALGGGSTDDVSCCGGASASEVEPLGGTVAQWSLVVAKVGPAGPRNTNLDHFHSMARINDCISSGSFVKIRGLCDCCRDNGKVELHPATSAEARGSDEEDGVVIVKRILRRRVHANLGCESNERLTWQCRGARESEDCLAEIGVYSYISARRDMPEYILRMRKAFTIHDHVWLVLEHCEGGDLYKVMEKRPGQGVPAKQLMRWMWQLLQAVSYLHRHLVGHRVISMEDILLRGGNLRLMDFGQAVQTHSSAGVPLRYFVAAGKPHYRGPECYNPAEALLQVLAPPRSQPGQVAFAASVSGEYLCEVRLPPNGVVAGRAAAAEPWGYAAAPADVFACGVCLLILATGLPSWRQARPSDPHFTYAYEQGVSQMLVHWDNQLPSDEEELLVSMLRLYPARRPTATDCLNSSWLVSLQSRPVPYHPSALVLARESSGHMEPCGSQELDAPQQAPQGRPDDTYAMDAMANNDTAWSEQVSSTAFAADDYTKPPVCRAGDNNGLRSEIIPAAGFALGDFYSSTVDGLGGLLDNGVGHVGGKPVCEPRKLPQLPLAPIAEVPWKLGLEQAGAGASTNGGIRGDTKASKEHERPSSGTERFSEEATPPSASSDSKFKFEPTILHVCGGTPTDVGNHLFGFLIAIGGSSVLKINRTKFTFKASFEGSEGTCVLTVRIYTEGPSRYAVEFQRRSGEAGVFYLLYKWAMEYLGHLVRALVPAESDTYALLQPGNAREVRLSSLDDWTDPGVRGLLKRSRRRQRPHMAPAGATAATKGCTGGSTIAFREAAEHGASTNPHPVPADCKV